MSNKSNPFFYIFFQVPLFLSQFRKSLNFHVHKLIASKYTVNLVVQLQEIKTIWILYKKNMGCWKIKIFILIFSRHFDYQIFGINKMYYE